MSRGDALTPTSRWDERYARICREHRNVIAVYESSDGRYALLLRHTLVPLRDEGRVWLKSTRRTAHAVVRDLRASGLRRPVVVLQWSPLERVAHIVQTWSCRYDADSTRREQHARVIAAQIADNRFLRARRIEHSRASRPRVDGLRPMLS